MCSSRVVYFCMWLISKNCIYNYSARITLGCLNFADVGLLDVKIVLFSVWLKLPFGNSLLHLVICGALQTTLLVMVT